MGVRPPQSDTDAPETVEFGIAAVAAKLDDADISYPANGEEVVRALSNPRIDYDASGHAVPLSDVVEQTNHARFDDQQELLNALHPVFEEYRTSHTPSLLDRVRALVPF